MAEPLSTLQLALLAQQAADQRRLLAAEPIAVIGLGCRFPAGADRPDLATPDSFWNFLVRGECAVREMPARRWSDSVGVDELPVGINPGQLRSKCGAFLKEIDGFDPGFFGISQREAQAMDPQHRLLLEVTQESLERAGYGAGQLVGSRTSAFMGLCTTDYAWRQLRQGCSNDHFDLYFATGNSFSVAAGRLAHVLGLQGPAMAVDTACSSSLVAVDLACRSLRDRTSDLALAGGVSLLLSPVNSLCFSRSSMMAPDGLCKTFDAAADGYGRGEGCGVVVLKRLADALAAGDPIWSVLRASGVNQDGPSAGLTVPNGAAQVALIRSTLEQAGLAADQIDVLEAHGTGTPLGDPIELKAVAQVYGGKERSSPLHVGSVKTNLGHLEGAAGIAGLIKAVLMVRQGRIPPHLHLTTPTTQFAWSDWALNVPRELQDWPSSGRPRRVAVSSFGFSGTNAHVLVEEAPPQAVLPWPSGSGEQWLLLAGRSQHGLEALVADYRSWLPQQPAESWTAICAAARRSLRPWPWRLAVCADDVDGALVALPRAQPVQCAPASRLLAMEVGEATTADQLGAWRDFGVQPTALVFDPEQECLARHLAGDPPTVRLVPRSDAGAVLEPLGYPPVMPLLTDPAMEGLVELWLAGQEIAWGRIEPPAPWRRPVLPVSSFDRQPCWIEGLTPQIAPQSQVPLDQRAVWRPIPPQVERPLAPRLLLHEVPDAIGLEALERTVRASPEPVDLVLGAALAESMHSTLDLEFWRRWLPLLQRLAQLPCRVHWLLGNQGTPVGEAMAALARGWARELGDQAGGLLWAGNGGEQAEHMLAAGPRSGEEWRWSEGRIESLAWEPVAPPSASALSAHSVAEALELKPGATVVISGGLGALGMATAEWLASQGVRHLTLLGRRGKAAAQESRVAQLESQGVTVQIERIDLADGSGLEELFERLAGPLAAVVHAAGVLDDGLLHQHSPERCTEVTAAKVSGGLQLEQLSRRFPKAWFIAYGSVAAVLGSPGQLAYGAANGYLAGLLAQRRRHGLKGLAIHWGPWAGPGMASRAPQSLPLIDADEALASLDNLLRRGVAAPAAAVVARLDPAGANHSALPQLRALASRLPGFDPPQALQAVQAMLIELIGDLAGTDPTALEATTRLDELGLDSLMAVELASVVQSGLGVSLGLGALSGEPTIGSLAAYLLELLRDPLGPSRSDVDLGTEAALPPDVELVLRQASPPSIRERPDHVLLTGGTGFLGAFLIADQLQRHPGLTLHCLVRAQDADAAALRLRQNLEHYDQWTPEIQERIVALPGDLARPQLGLDPECWQQLVDRVGGVLHNGAQLSYVAPYGQLRAANVGGTVQVLRLAAQKALPVEFVSSTAVYEATAYRGQPLDETSDLCEWRGIHLGYSQTKWVSERLVWQAAAAGLPVRIHRPPLIAGHSKTGAWHQDDFLHRLIRGCLALGQAPQLDLELDLVPVDYVVAAIGALAWQPLPQPAGQPHVLHLHHPRPVLWDELLAALGERGAPLAAVPLDSWLAVLAQHPENPLYPLQPFFRQRWGPEQLTYAELNGPDHKARPSCSTTQALLAAMGVECPPFEDLIAPYAFTFLGHG